MKIIKKFLCKKKPDNVKILKECDVEQYYIYLSPHIATRREGKDYYLIIEDSTNMHLINPLKIYISDVEFFKLFPQSLKGLKKEIIEIQLSNTLTAEIHRYKNNVEFIEVEFQSEDEANSFQAPHWFRREVTDDLEYSDINLAR